MQARYTDPQTKIRYANPEEFTRVRTLPSDLVTGYLALRKASAPVPWFHKQHLCSEILHLSMLWPWSAVPEFWVQLPLWPDSSATYEFRVASTAHVPNGVWVLRSLTSVLFFHRLCRRVQGHWYFICPRAWLCFHSVWRVPGLPHCTLCPDFMQMLWIVCFISLCTLHTLLTVL